MTKEEIDKAVKSFKRFKKKYFKNYTNGFTGEELEQCKVEFWKKYKPL